MSDHPTTQTTTEKWQDSITIHLRCTADGKLWCATSPDLPGLYVAGRSREQVMAEVPLAIDEMESTK